MKKVYLFLLIMPSLWMPASNEAIAQNSESGLLLPNSRTIQIDPVDSSPADAPRTQAESSQKNAVSPNTGTTMFSGTTSGTEVGNSKKAMPIKNDSISGMQTQKEVNKPITDVADPKGKSTYPSKSSKK